jgi:hypothetical protein
MFSVTLNWMKRMETTPGLTDYKCNKTGSVCINITLWGVCAAIVAVVKQ